MTVVTKGINRVVLIGRVVGEPAHKVMLSGCGVCRLRVALDGTGRNPITGEWNEKPSVFGVTVFGLEADRTAALVRSGGIVGIDGHLEWREWETEDGEFGEAIGVIAEDVQFIAAVPEDTSGPVRVTLGEIDDEAQLGVAAYA